MSAIAEGKRAAAAALLLADLINDAEAIRWDAGPKGTGGMTNGGGFADPTAGIALDEARLHFSGAVTGAELVLKTALDMLGEARATLAKEIDRFRGLEDNE
jgi:hypothetical protein